MTGSRRPAIRLTCLASIVPLAAAVLGCREPAPEPPPVEEPPVVEEPVVEAPKVDIGVEFLQRSMDSSADPCQDFHQYACGGWAAATERPAHRPRYSRSFTMIDDRNTKIVQRILEQAVTDSKAADAPAATAKLATYYGACMDEAAIEAADAAPLEPILKEIDGVKDLPGLMKEVGRLHATVYGHTSWFGGAAPVLFSVDVSADSKERPDTEMLSLYQGGLGLPSRQLYLDDSEGAKKIRAYYETHVAKMLEMGGMKAADSAKMAKGVLAFETKLAKASLPPEELRDPYKTYNKIGLKGLQKRAAALDWNAYFKASGWPADGQLNVGTPQFFTALNATLTTTPMPVVKAYLRYHVTQSLAPKLSKRFAEGAFELQKTTQGVAAMPPRNKRCIDATVFALTDLVGPLFIAKAFKGNSKAIADDMIERINRAMEQSLPNLAWMDEPTRAAARDKIAKMSRKIGHPVKWKDYADVTLGNSWAGNAIAEATSHHNRQVAKVGKPVDRDEWGMPVPIVNAYYNPSNNEIAFPAGIMQPPFFSETMPAPMNFGGIGAVIGHELTHGFDDEGRKYDGSGALRTWWSDDVSAKFEERVACVQEQYSAFEPVPGAKVNGKLTSGENIADIGGVKEAYYAWKSWEAENGNPAPYAEGLTNDQLFFVAWAQNWCDLSAEEFARRLVETDPHSPGKFRAVGPLMNLPAFAEAFSCQPGTPMRPANACEIW